MDRLAESGARVVVPVRKSSAARFRPSAAVETREADLADPSSAADLVKGVDAVFHLASLRGSSWASSDEEVRAVNVALTENLLRASTDEGVSRFIYLSSVSVFGHPRGGPIDEERPPSPETRYGRTKHDAEQLVRDLSAGTALYSTIVRPVITYGPRDDDGMVTKLVRLIAAGRYLTVGSGENRVHLIYIDDLIDGLMLTLQSESARGRTYILSGREPITVNRLVQIICSLRGRKEPRPHIPLWFAHGCAVLLEVLYRTLSIEREPVITRDKLDIMCRDRFFDSRKAQQELGFSPATDYPGGLGKTIAWLETAAQS